MPEFMINFLVTLIVTYDYEVINWFNTYQADEGYEITMRDAARYMAAFNRYVDMNVYV